MTISTTESRIEYLGNGASKIFAIPFRFLENSHIVVTLVTAAGVQVPQSQGADYVLAGADEDTGGFLTMVVAPPVSSNLIVLRVVPATQETDYISGDPFPAESHERALDKLTMLVQQNEEVGDRSLKFPVGDLATQIGELPPAAGRAGRLLAFDNFGRPVTTAPVGGSATDLALALAAASGSAMIGYDVDENYPVGSLGEAVKNSIPRLADYTALRAYSNDATTIRITNRGIAGLFFIDLSDVVTADNHGTVIVDAIGRRWKRDVLDRYDVLWFGASTAVADNSVALQRAVDALPARGGEISFPGGQFEFTNIVNLGNGNGGATASTKNGIKIVGAGAGFAVSGALVPTILNYSGTATPLALLTIKGRISDVRMENLFLSCNGLCSGVSLLSVSGSTFQNLKIVNPRELGISVIGGGPPVGNYNVFNKFSTINIALVTPNSIGLYMDGNYSIQNDTWISNFELMRIETLVGATNSTCAWFKFVDSCSLHRCHFDNKPEPTSKCVIFDAMANAGFPVGMAFYDCSVHETLVFEDATHKIRKNSFYNYGSYDNEILPTHRFLCGVTDVGVVFGDWLYGEPWVSYAPAVTSTVGTITTVAGAIKYRKLGRLVFFQCSIFITTNGTGATSIRCALPPDTGLTGDKIFFASGKNKTTNAMIQAEISAGANVMFITRYDGTYPGANNTDLQISGFYEVVA